MTKEQFENQPIEKGDKIRTDFGAFFGIFNVDILGVSWDNGYYITKYMKVPYQSVIEYMPKQP